MTPLKTVFRLDSVTKLADKLSVSVLAVLLSSTSLASQELPQNGQILSGTGSIVQDGADMSITQNSANLDIDWNSFSIGAENTVTFKQPSATSTALNRVTGTQTSAIHGKMTANGRVFLLNPNGVMFGAGAQVNVGSLVASTLGLSKTETNNSGSQHEFEGDSAAAITNAGQIATNDGGTIALIAAKVTNTGSLTAPGGTVALGAGRRVRLDLGGTVALEVDEAAVDALITQGGAIRADGGLIYLGAKAAGDLAQTVINHSGTSQAQTLATGKDGRIFLMGDMRNDQIDVSGTLDASAPNGGDGGFVETSAAQLMLRDGLRVTTKAHLGKTGTWLIDPTDIEIIAGDNDSTDDSTTNWSANQIKAGTINAALAENNLEIETVPSGDEAGNITVNAGLTWGKNTLKLTAHDNIIINAKIDATGGDGTGGGLVLHYGQNNLGTSSYRINAPIDLASDSSFETKNGADAEINHTIITKLGLVGSTTGIDLQGMRGKYDGNYVLGADIDASATSAWNGDKGFDPIGFAGTLDGLGHEIIGLNVNRPDAARAGLFGFTVNANLQNITLRDATITGKTAGGLVGLASGTSFNNITTHNINVTGTDHVGGLVGNASGTSFNNITSHNINVTGTDHVGGLVGWATTNTNFNTIRLDDINVTGTGNVGGLVGNAFEGTTIETSYAMGTVTSTGAGTNAGGLVGWAVGADIKTSYAAADVSSTSETDDGTVGGLVGNATNTNINNAYATGKVAASSATADIGGLVGRASGGTIANTYATGEVTGGHALSDAGGLVGSVDGGTITASLWDKETTGQKQGVGKSDDNIDDTTGATSAELRTQQTYTDAGWDFTKTWFMLDGQTRPFLRFEHSQTITNPRQLQLMAMKPDLDFTLGADIDMQAALKASHTDTNTDTNTDRYSGMWGPKGFAPVGDVDNSFTGTFDGLGHVIKNLTINDPEHNDGFGLDTGLFGSAEGATFRNIGLTNVNISGSGDANGGLLGYGKRVAIENAYVTGKVTGTARTTGGLVGEAAVSRISNSYVLGDVSGKDHVGGLAGTFFSSFITNAYATGAVSGTNYIGGLMGFSTNSNIANVYATGAVSGTNYIGGLVGQAVDQTLIRGTFATGAVTGTNYVGGLVGVSAGSSSDPSSKYAKIQTSYATGEVSGSDSHVGGLVGRAKYTHITNTYATGKVTGKTKVGGLVGSSTAKVGQGFDRAKIQTSYATGMVSGSDDVGGLVGHADKTAITLSFWDNGTTGLSRGIGASVETTIDDTTGATSKVDQLATFTGATWNISADGNDDSVWRIYEGQAAPLLRIFMKKVNVTGQAVTRDYNGKTDATISDLKFAETVKGVSVASSGIGQYADANAGEDKTVTFNINYALADGETDLHTVLQRYDFVEPELKGTINKKALTITANNALKTYGETLTFDGTEFTADALQNGETISVNLTSAGAAKKADAGSYSIEADATAAEGSGFNAGNYTITYAKGELKVAKRDLTITANDASKTYGDTQTFDGTEFEVEEGALQNGETISVNLTSGGAAKTADAGSYNITAAATAAEGSGFNADNYTITYANGELKVAKRDLTITANDASKIYGETLTFKGTEFEVEEGALQNNETIGSVTLTSKGTVATENVDDYTITAAAATAATGSGFNADNYTITYANGELKVAKRDLTITANDASKTYGETLTFDGTEFEVEEGALQNGETISKVTLTSAGAAETANVDDYTITAAAATAAEDSGFNAGNYTISYKAGTLNVVEPLNVSGAVEPGSSSTVSKAPSAANPTRPETCVETNGMAPLVLNLPELTEYCVDTSGSNPAQFTLVEKSGIALPTASDLLSLAALRQ